MPASRVPPIEGRCRPIQFNDNRTPQVDRALPTSILRLGKKGRQLREPIQQLLTSRHASWLTHGSLALLFVAEFTLILKSPFWVMLIPCTFIHHRIGIL